MADGRRTSRARPAPGAPGAPLPLVLSCEHGGNAVPAPWRGLARGRRRLLASHRGQDAGAAELALALGRRLGAVPWIHRATRLLVDVNRSLDHPAVFSELTAGLSARERARLIATLWRPHRARVEAAVRDALRRVPLLCHVGVHSFTPVLAGRRRPMHVGLLYDPARERESLLARRWKDRLAVLAPRLVVRRNAPYRGDSDGLTTTLRGELGARYLGLELEVRSDRLRDADAVRLLAEPLAASLRAALASLEPR